MLELIKGFLDGLRPERRITVSDWADKYRYLSSVAASEPGPWRTERTPYLRAIMDDLSAYSAVQKVVFMKGAQIGATEAGNNWLGYIVDAAPAPTLMVQPTDDMVKRNSKLRIDTMIEATPRLREKIAPARSRDSNNTLNSKGFPGGILIMAGANSPAGLRSMPARNLFLDEVDAYPHDLDGEGSPIDLAMARTRTFARKKIFIVSTPTIAGMSAIEAEYERTDQREYHVPCPECGTFQPIQFERLRYEGSSKETFVPDSVRLECAHCGNMMEEREKPWLLTNGKWFATKPELASETATGYFLNSLYSPYGWYSWAQAIADFLDAQGDTPKMKTFVNTVLGLTWKGEGEAPAYKNLHNRRELYGINKPPTEVAFITAGVDVQKDRLELEIVGWCEGKRSYSIDYRVLVGDTAQKPVWDELAKVIDEKWTRVDGVPIPLRMMAVDSGYNSQEVYSFCRRFDATKVIPTKGSDSLNVPVSVPRAIDVAKSGRKIGKVKIWNVGVSVLKSELYGWLRLEKADGETVPDGYCHFPQYDERYFRGLTAEKLQFHVVKGFRKYEWVKEYPRNEPLDCRIYARAAATVVGMDRFTASDWEQLRLSYGGAVEEKKVVKKKSNYW